MPWDFETVSRSVKKTGRLVVSHEAPRSAGFAAEVVADIQVGGHLEASRTLPVTLSRCDEFTSLLTEK